MGKYQGHRSWNAWNVSLWISNDEPLYRFAMECLKGVSNNKRGLAHATRYFMAMIGGNGVKTPDGAYYNRICVKEALAGLME